MWGQGHRGCVSFLRASSLTRNVHGKSFLKDGSSVPAFCLNSADSLMLAKSISPLYQHPVNITAIHRKAIVCWNSHAAHRTPTSRIMFIPQFQSQAREQVYERLMPPYMAAVSSYFLQKLHFSLSPSAPAFPSIPEMQLQKHEGEE